MHIQKYIQVEIDATKQMRMEIWFETAQKLQRWKRYVELFQDGRPEEHGITEAPSGPSTTEDKAENAIKLTEKLLDPTEYQQKC